MSTPYRTNCPPPKYDDVKLRDPYTRRFGGAIIGVALALSVTACAWFQKNGSYFPTPADVACVYAQVENGVSDPATILVACPKLVALAMEDLLALISGVVLGKAHRIEAAARDAGAPEHLTCVAHGADMICSTAPSGPRDAGAEGGR